SSTHFCKYPFYYIIFLLNHLNHISHYSYQNILFQFSIFNIISLHVLLLSSSPRTLHPYSSSFNHLTNLFLSITSSIYLSSNSISFSLSPIRVIKFTSNPFPIQKYLIRSFIPSVQLSRSEKHTSKLQSLFDLICRLLL